MPDMTRTRTLAAIAALAGATLPSASAAAHEPYIAAPIPDTVSAWYDVELDMFCTSSNRLSVAADEPFFIVCEPAIHLEDIPASVTFDALMASANE